MEKDKKRFVSKVYPVYVSVGYVVVKNEKGEVKEKISYNNILSFHQDMTTGELRLTTEKETKIFPCAEIMVRNHKEKYIGW